jgi:hypothetical protein
MNILYCRGVTLHAASTNSEKMDEGENVVRHIRLPDKYGHCWPWRSSNAEHIREKGARGRLLQLNFQNMRA